MKISSKCAIAALALVGAASAASAQSTVSFARSGDNPNGFNGGEFTATFTNGAQSLRAFCLERAVTFTPNAQYGYSFDTVARSGGPGSAGSGGNSPDPISAATAWIFTQFLSGETFGIVDPQARNVTVQLAIWKLEEENGPFTYGGLGITEANVNSLIALVPGDYGNLLDGFGNATEFGEFANIRAINPTNVDGTGDYQSMIVLIPLPTASGMALAGLALVGGIRRRK